MKKFISSLIALSMVIVAAPKAFAQDDDVPAYEESLDDMALEDETFKEEVAEPAPAAPKAKEVKKAVKKSDKKQGKKAAKAKSKNSKKKTKKQ